MPSKKFLLVLALALNIPYRRTKSFQCFLKACRTHECSSEHIDC